MKMYMIATINNGDKRIGFRILDSDECKVIDVPEASVLNVLKSGQKIINLEIRDGKIQGNNGDINRYARICDGKLMSGDRGPLVVLNQIGENGYTISDHIGQIKKAKMADVISYASKNGIANGKISTRNSTEFISAISGTYEKIEIPYNNTQSLEKNTISETEKITENEANETESVIDLSFTPEQRSVLKDYYSWANIDKNVANKEIEYLDKIIKEDKKEAAYKCTKLLYEILTKLGSNFNIAKAFGVEIGSKLISFIAVELPFPKSIIIKCIEYVNIDIVNFYKIVFSNFEEAIELILKSKYDTFGLASKTYLEYMANKELLGKYKGYDNEEDSKDKEFIKKYAVCESYTFTEMLALIATIDILKEFSGEVSLNMDRQIMREHKKELTHISLAYFYAATNDGNTRDDKKALIEAIGFEQEFYDEEAVKYLGKKVDVIDKTFDKTPYNKYENCIFESTPYINDSNKRFTPKKTIEDLYRKQFHTMQIGHSLVIGRFNNFVKEFYAEIDKENRKRAQEEINRQAEEQRVKDAERRKQQEAQRLEAQRLEAQRLEDEKRKRVSDIKIEDTTDKKGTGIEDLREAIRLGTDLTKFDKVDIYTELKSIIGGQFTDRCFIISDDMMARKLKYDDMSKNQKYRFDEAIASLLVKLTTASRGLNTTKTTDTDKKDTNQSYSLDTHADIQEKVNKLIEKADSVEMSAVLSKDPIVLKICYSVLKYKKASEKQLKHINEAFSMLEIQ